MRACGVFISSFIVTSLRPGCRGPQGPGLAIEWRDRKGVHRGISCGAMAECSDILLNENTSRISTDRLGGLVVMVTASWWPFHFRFRVRHIVLRISLNFLFPSSLAVMPEIAGSSPTRTVVGNNLEQVIQSRGAQVNSAFHPSRVGK